MAWCCRPRRKLGEFFLAWCRHLNRGLIGVYHTLGQHRFAPPIDQRLELHAGLPDPLRQRRASNRQPGAAKDLLLPVQRQVVGELRQHHMGQQNCSRDDDAAITVDSHQCAGARARHPVSSQGDGLAVLVMRSNADFDASGVSVRIL